MSRFLAAEAMRKCTIEERADVSTALEGNDALCVRCFVKGKACIVCLALIDAGGVEVIQLTAAEEVQLDGIVVHTQVG